MNGEDPVRVLLQRVSQARVTVNQQAVGSIQRGVLLLVAIEPHDTLALIERMRDKVLAYRIFPDKSGKMNLSVREVNGGVLAVSQFTLGADTRKGLRPGFSKAAEPALARTLFDAFVRALQAAHQPIATGTFGADMQVSLINDGPVTFLLEL